TTAVAARRIGDEHARSPDVARSRATMAQLDRAAIARTAVARARGAALVADARARGGIVGAIAAVFTLQTVVAGLVADHAEVPADDLRRARLARDRALPVRFEAALSIATVAGRDVEVVALLVVREHAVATERVGHAELTGHGAAVAGFASADVRATVAGDRVAVVAGLRILDLAVAAHRPRHGLARHPRRRTVVAGLDETRRRATVARHVVGVVAAFGARDHPVATDDRRDTRLAGRGTYVIGLERAHARAAVA